MKTIKDFKTRTKKALDAHEKEFTIEGFEFNTKFAGYMVMYLDQIKLPDELLLKKVFTQGKHGEGYEEASGNML